MLNLERCCKRCAHIISEHKPAGCICCPCPEFVEDDGKRKLKSGCAGRGVEFPVHERTSVDR